MYLVRDLNATLSRILNPTVELLLCFYVCLFQYFILKDCQFTSVYLKAQKQSFQQCKHRATNTTQSKYILQYLHKYTTTLSKYSSDPYQARQPLSNQNDAHIPYNQRLRLSLTLLSTMTARILHLPLVCLRLYLH